MFCLLSLLLVLATTIARRLSSSSHTLAPLNPIMVVDNKVIDRTMNSSNVQVVVRLRPLNSKEKKHGTLPVVSASTADKSVTVIKGSGSRQARSSYTFDNVFTAFSTQEEVFDATLKPVLSDVLKGFESTVFAYGQTGTGKTHTMEGDIDDPDQQGVIPRSAKSIFDALSSPEYTESNVKVSFLEIYNEDLCDLLQPDQTKLDIMVGKNGPFCRGLSSTTVESADQVLELMRKAQDQRQVGETNMNKQSSRSHCIFTISVNAKRTLPGDNSVLEIAGKLHCVDLAGSECAKSADLEKGNESQAARERERKNINQSLLTLGRVVSMLKEQSSSKKKQSVRIPYRDSKLTRILQESLGGRCKTCLIATISPSVTAIEESMSTLNYAQAANGIINKPVTASLISSTGGSGMPASVASGPKGGKNDGGSVELWMEMETRLEYMKNQVEEAQQALARKHLQQQELVERAEKAEQAKDQAEHMLGVAKAENDTLKDEIKSHVDEKENLKLELSHTQTRLKETAVILKETKKTEESLTGEAQSLLRALLQTIQDTNMLHRCLVEQREQEMQRKLSTKEFYDSSVALLGSVDKSLATLRDQEKEFAQLASGNTQEVVQKLASFFENQKQSLETLSGEVQSSSQSMKSKLNNELLLSSEGSASKIGEQVREARQILENGHQTLLSSCQTIEKRLKDSSSQLSSMQSAHQGESQSLLKTLTKRVCEVSANLEAMVTTASASLNEIQRERSAASQALQSMVLEWQRSSSTDTSSIMSTSAATSEQILDLLKSLAEHQSCHREMEKHLADERAYIQRSRESHLVSLGSQKKLLEQQTEVLQKHFKLEADTRQEFMQSVMKGVESLMQQQMDQWEHQAEERFQKNTEISNNLQNQHSLIESSSETIMSTVEATNKELTKNVGQVCENHTAVTEFLQQTTSDMESIQTTCKKNLSSVEEQAEKVQKQHAESDTKLQESVELCRENLTSEGNSCGYLLKNDISTTLAAGVRQLEESTDKVFDHVNSEVIAAIEESIEKHVQVEVDSLVKTCSGSLDKIAATAEEANAKVAKHVGEQCDLVDTMESLINEAAVEMKDQSSTSARIMQDFGNDISATIANHDSSVSEKIQACQDQTNEVCTSSEKFTFETMEASKETKEVPKIEEPCYTSKFSKTPSDDTILKSFYEAQGLTMATDCEGSNDKENGPVIQKEDKGEDEATPMKESESSKIPVLQDKSMNEEEVVDPTAPEEAEVPAKRRTAEKRTGSRLKKPRTRM